MDEEGSRIYRLFGYETDGGKSSILWDNPDYFWQPGGQGGKELDEGFSQWMDIKRPIQKNEAVQGHWVKISDQGRLFIVKLHRDGSLTESGPSSPFRSWSGRWKIMKETLRLYISRYELDIIVNRKGIVHSGIEVNNLKDYSYFKIIKLPI